MSLTEQTITAIETSFELVKPKADELIDHFYTNLFKAAPSVRPLFPTDMTEQKRKLLGAVALTVENLRNPEKLVPVLETMGANHISYGAEEAHYPLVTKTMREAIAHVAGDAWTEELNTAWKEALDLVSDSMIAGARKLARKAA